MQRDPNTWLLASQLLEENGTRAFSNVRDLAKTFSDPRDEGDRANLVRIMSAMDLLFTESGSGTIH
jgi:hypothetical protein